MMNSNSAQALWGWLADRGLATPTPAWSDAGVAPKSAPAAPRVLFVADGEGDETIFSGEERELMGRMVQAMKLAPHAVRFVCAANFAGALTALDPETVVVLGEAATPAALGEDVAFSSARGKFHHRADAAAPIMVSFHPRDLLLNPASKRLAWADLQLVMERLCLPKPV